MAFGTTGVLGIEIGSNQLRLVRAVALGGRLRVDDFVLEDILVSNPENSARQLDTVIERKKLRSFPAALALSGPGVVHRHLDFPPMPHNELALVVEREIKTGGGVAADDTVFSWEAIEGPEAANLKQIRVLVAIAPKTEVEAAQQLLARCRLKPALFTTAPLALLRALRFAHSGDKRSHVVLYVGGQQGYLLGVKDGAWDFYREFSGRASENRGDALMEEAVMEANRALLYYRQRYREGEESNFLLSGERGIEELRTRLERETGIRGEIVQPGPELDLTPLGGRSNLFREMFPSFIIPLGLAAAAYAPQGVNLAPKTATRAVRRPAIDWSLAQRPVVAVILLAVLLAGYLALSGMERRYERLRQERSSLYSQWLPAIQGAEETRALRDSEQLLAQSLGTSRVAELKWIGLFKALSRLTEADTLLQSLTLYKDAGRWVITLKGEVVSRDAYTAQAVFNRFYQGLKRSPYLQQLELLPLNVTTTKERVESAASKAPERVATEGASQNPPEAVEIKKTKVEFEVRAEAKDT